MQIRKDLLFLLALTFSSTGIAAPMSQERLSITDFLADCSSNGSGSTLNCATCKHKHPVLDGILTIGYDGDLAMCTAPGERSQCLIVERAWDLVRYYKTRCSGGCSATMAGEYYCAAGYNALTPDMIVLNDPDFHLTLGKTLLKGNDLRNAGIQFDIVEKDFPQNPLSKEAHQLNQTVKEKMAAIRDQLAAVNRKKETKAQSTRNNPIAMEEIGKECFIGKAYDSGKCPWENKPIMGIGMLVRQSEGLYFCNSNYSSCLKVEVPIKMSMEWERRCRLPGCHVTIKGKLLQKIRYQDKRLGIVMKEEFASLIGTSIQEIPK